MCGRTGWVATDMATLARWTARSFDEPIGGPPWPEDLISRMAGPCALGMSIMGGCFWPAPRSFDQPEFRRKTGAEDSDLFRVCGAARPILENPTRPAGSAPPLSASRPKSAPDERNIARIRAFRSSDSPADPTSGQPWTILMIAPPRQTQLNTQHWGGGSDV